MSDEIPIFNGGEAPQVAPSISGSAVAGEDQGSVMQQNGGPAPEPGVGGEPMAPADAGGAPPLGGAVHG